MKLCNPSLFSMVDNRAKAGRHEKYDLSIFLLLTRNFHDSKALMLAENIGKCFYVLFSDCLNKNFPFSL